MVSSPASRQSQRELTRHYKQSLRPMGVYAIRNLVDGRVFVGGSLDLDGAINRHRFELAMKGHRNAALMRDWLRHGEAGFAFEILDRIKEREDPDFDYQGELDGLVEAWREELGACGPRGYNARAARP